MLVLLPWYIANKKMDKHTCWKGPIYYRFFITHYYLPHIHLFFYNKQNFTAKS